MQHRFVQLARAGSPVGREGVSQCVATHTWNVAMCDVLWQCVMQRRAQAIEGDEGPGGGAHWTRRATEWNRVRPDLWPDRMYDNDEPYDEVDEHATANQDQEIEQEEQDRRAVEQAAVAAGSGEPVSMQKNWSWEDLVPPDCPNAVQLQLCCGGLYVALVGKAVDKAARWALNLPGAVPDAYIANRCDLQCFPSLLAQASGPLLLLLLPCMSWAYCD